jgi:hypothetical protein
MRPEPVEGRGGSGFDKLRASTSSARMTTRSGVMGGLVLLMANRLQLEGAV